MDPLPLRSFRLSDFDLEKLDSIVAHFRRLYTDQECFAGINRSSVIRRMIQERFDLNTEEENKVAASLERARKRAKRRKEKITVAE